MDERITAWLDRPRKPLLEAVPKMRLVQALFFFPYICAAGLILYIWGQTEATEGDVLFMVFFSVVAVLESLFLVVWLRRPVKKHEDYGE